jgi:hypothetical protein
MLIKESKLRQIIKSVIRESMGAAGMPPGGGMDPKIQAMNLLKNQLMQMSGGKLDMFVDQKVLEHIEDDQPYVYGSFEDLGGANIYSVYMFDDEFRISLDVSVDEIDQMSVPVNPSQVVADGAASLAAEVMQEWSNNFPGSGGTKTRGGSGTVNNDWEYEEDDSYDEDDSEDEFDEELLRAEEAERLRQLANPPPKPRYRKSQGYDPYDVERSYHKQELANWNAQYGKKKK